MVRNRRIRTWLTQIGLWALIAVLMGYFGYHAVHGERGLKAHRSFEAEIAGLKTELAALENQRTVLERQVSRLNPASVDRDQLDEEARTSLGWMHPNDRVLTLD